MVRPRYDIQASGRRMREVRVARGLSAKEVMDYMGFESVQAIYKWESGKCFPQADNLLALAKFYQVNPFELIVEEDLAGSFSFFSFRTAAPQFPRLSVSRLFDFPASQFNHWLNDF